MLAGAAIGTGVAVTTARTLAFPAPVAVASGLLIGGPIAAVSYMNNHGNPNSLLGSMLVGAAPLALAGGAIGLFGAGWSQGSGKALIATSVIMGTLTGAAIGGITHALTKPH